MTAEGSSGECRLERNAAGGFGAKSFAGGFGGWVIEDPLLSHGGTCFLVGNRRSSRVKISRVTPMLGWWAGEDFKLFDRDRSKPSLGPVKLRSTLAPALIDGITLRHDTHSDRDPRSVRPLKLHRVIAPEAWPELPVEDSAS
jgi:hypothetical protein